MASIVSTGWRKVRPGACSCCGFDTDWECDGSGRIYCSCETCPECGEFNGHDSACAELRRLRDEANEIEVS